MKDSTDFKLTPAERKRDRMRAERALGRPTRPPECVHHHSKTQLVICQDTEYHALLHRLHHDYRVAHEPAFVEFLEQRHIERLERAERMARRECDAIRGVFNRMGITDEEIDCEINEWPPLQAS